MSQSSSTASVELLACSNESLPQVADLALPEVESHTARPDEPPAEPGAAELRRHVEEVAPETPAEGRRGQVRHVARERAEIAGMVGQPFELERDSPEGLRACADPGPRERLDQVGVGQRVADRRVARGRLHVVDRPFRRSPDERGLDAAVLIAEGDLEMEDVLAMTLETEVAGLDDARVDGPDGDLVDFGSGHGEEVDDTGQNRRSRLPAPRVATGAIRVMEADGLHPGMSLGPQAVLLGDFPLEQVCLRNGIRDRFEAVASNRCAQEADPAVFVVRQDGDQLRGLGSTVGRRIEREVRSQPLTLRRDGANDPFAKLRRLRHRRVLQRQHAGVAQGARHGACSSTAAARSTKR